MCSNASTQSLVIALSREGLIYQWSKIVSDDMKREACIMALIEAGDTNLSIGFGRE